MRKTGQFIILKKRDKKKTNKNKLVTISWEPVGFLSSSDIFFLMIDLLDTLIESLARFWLKGNMLININRQHIKYSNRQSVKIRVHMFSLLKNTQIAISISFFHRHSFFSVSVFTNKMFPGCCWFPYTDMFFSPRNGFCDAVIYIRFFIYGIWKRRVLYLYVGL